MRNNKGFTLMELVAAIFIGGMVTAALVLIWKTASVQTSQGQRQTIVRNQISNFQRQLYRDFYSADIITFPTSSISANPNSQTTTLLTGFKKAKQINNLQFEAFIDAPPKGPTKEFCYCITDYHNIRRFEHTISASASNVIKNFSDFEGNDSCFESCKTGEVVLTDFTLTSANLTDGYNYNLKGVVNKVFNQTSGTTPIYIEIDETLLKQGGI